MRRAFRTGLITAILIFTWATGSALHYDEMPEERRQPRDLPYPRVEPQHVPPPDEYSMAEGFRLEMVAGGLTYPSSVAWDGDGRLHVVESGYAYGPSTAIPRILHVDEAGELQEIARLPDGPLTGIVWHEDAFFVVGGRDPGRVWKVAANGDEVETILTGFPVWGRHFTSGLTVDEEGRLHFAVGDPTNSGVLGLDDYFTYGYLSIFPGARSIPCIELRIHAHAYGTEDPYDPHPDARTRTGAFQRFGQPAQEGQIVGGAAPPGCNGAVYRAERDGSGLEVIASGLRHVQGIGFAPDGRLLVTEEGMRPSGSRPVADACDALWAIEEDAWYGFPDHVCGEPITQPRFRAENRSAPQPILIDPPPVAGKPLHAFTPNSGSRHFDFAKGGAFGEEGSLFVAQSGSHFEDPPQGHRIVRLDLESGTESVFYENLRPGPEGTAPERPHALRFGPDGALYLVDEGLLTTTTKTFHPSALTGALWRIVADEPSEEEADP